jgi:hypothetical protein
MSLLLIVSRIVQGAEVCYNELVPCEIIGYIRGTLGSWRSSGIVSVADFISGVEQGKDGVKFCKSILIMYCSTLDQDLPTRSFTIGMIHCHNIIRKVGKGWFSRKEGRGKKLALLSLMAPGRADDKGWGVIGRKRPCLFFSPT